MAEKLHSIITIDNTDYEVVAETAKKVEHGLTINVQKTTDSKDTVIFDGSGSAKSLTIDQVKKAETADKVANALTIHVVNGTTETYSYDGSAAQKITINAVEDAGHAGVADSAKKVENKLTINVIKDGVNTPVEFDGSEAKTIDVGDANKIQVNLDNDQKAYATITIRANDPAGGNVGDIWFKY